MKKIILASGSPRRRELLKLAGFDFEVKTADTDENVDESLEPGEVVKILAKRKAAVVAAQNSDCIVIGADTVVSYENEILGKPKNEKEAFSMLKSLSGKTHYVFTGVCIINGDDEICFCEKTAVTFFELNDSEIENYISTGDCFDKAGGYGIQSNGCILVEKINGDYFNVVGLPIAKTSRILKKFFR